MGLLDIDDLALGSDEEDTAAAMKTGSPQGHLAGPRLFVALSQFTVANGMSDKVKQAFLQRPHLVDQAPGFVRLEVISPVDNPDEIWLLTYWSDESSYRDWHRSHLYRDSHGGIPKGLKLVPQGTRLRFFEYICS